MKRICLLVVFLLIFSSCSKRQDGRSAQFESDKKYIINTYLKQLNNERLIFMQAAGQEMMMWEEKFRSMGTNVVAEVLKGQGEMKQGFHYPKGDISDPRHNSLYFFHSHREAELGHFHLYLRDAGIPPGFFPTYKAGRKDASTHIGALSMDANGVPIRFFTTNEWVTRDNWYPTGQFAHLVDLFCVDEPKPHVGVNRWVSACVRLFYPQLVQIHWDREQLIEKMKRENPNRDVYFDRGLDETSDVLISIPVQIEAIEELLRERGVSFTPANPQRGI